MKNFKQAKYYLKKLSNPLKKKVLKIKSLQTIEVIAGEADSLKYTTISINKITNLEFEGN